MSRKVALITGASRGIGAAIARQLASEGYAVAITGRSLESPSHNKLSGTLRELESEIHAQGNIARAYELDVSKQGQAEEVIQKAVDDLGGRLDVLVQNAGAIYPFESPSNQQIDTMLSVNTRGVLFCARAALPHLEKVGGQAVSISPPLSGSTLWMRLTPLGEYAITKYSMSMAMLWLSSKIKSNSIWPKRVIATAATHRLETSLNDGKLYFTNGRSPEYFASCVSELLRRPVNGQGLLDEDLLQCNDDARAVDAAPLDLFV